MRSPLRSRKAEVGFLTQRRSGAAKSGVFRCAVAPLREKPFSIMQTTEAPNRSTLALWEIISVVISCLIAEWVVLAFIGANKVVLAIPIVMALVLMIFSHRVYEETLHEIGFRM